MKAKFVRATVSEVRTGFEKPNMEKMVAEKYLHRLAGFNETRNERCIHQTVEATRLLKALQETGNEQSSSVRRVEE